ncbi:MAG: thioredoxin domain-containing protein [Gammaproteobacteria bacterium]|nr:thioredoxin domain-containing protein [Gammaproteobacteria bacterium]NIO26321.1 thioredoxin domain-containing protein [Gammaproteobacteria bacterium]NIO66873.1 thioredoxin domain-containing protein [Gammaproteobacteria bacterium]NIP66082.1 thioredoxin domain-containing protein [Gammaproteobacteria bacterium]NIQ28153.1 thioredoxin domain-containing protein [Gammaproteobacteria bacterium]
MNRISPVIASLAVVAVTALLAGVPSPAAGTDPAGKYDLVLPPQPTDTPDKIEVVEVFWYGCPHCFTFLPTMEQYAKDKPDDVALRHMPAIFRDSWVAHARAFYTADVLGVQSKIHRPLFEAIHVRKQRLDTRESLAAFFEQHGVSKQDFDKTWDSFAVQTLMRKSQVMQQRYGVRGTPTVIVNGKYRVSGSLAGPPQEMIKVIEALVERERAAKPASG